MRIILQVRQDNLVITLPSPPGKIKADSRIILTDGESWEGFTYNQLLKLGSGDHVLERVT